MKKTRVIPKQNKGSTQGHLNIDPRTIPSLIGKCVDLRPSLKPSKATAA